MKKKVLIIGLLLISLFLISFIVEAKDGNIVNLELNCTAGYEESTIDGLVDLFNETHPGINVELNAGGRSGRQDHLVIILQSGAKTPDIIQNNTIWPSTFAALGWIKALDPYMDDPDLKPNDLSLNDFPPGLLESCSYKGKVYGLPQDLSGYHLYYRTDLIDSPPQTWKEFEEVAREFTQSINPDSPTKYGTVWQGQRGSLNPKEWSNIFWSMGGKWLINENGTLKPGIYSEAGIKSLEYRVRFIKDKLVPPDVVNYAYTDSNIAFQQGLVPMILQWSAAYAGFISPEQSPKIYDKVAITEVPGVKKEDGTIYRTPFTQGQAYMVNANSDHPKEAAQFIMWLMSRSTQKIYALGTHATAAGNTASLPVMTDPEVIKARPEYELFYKTFAIGKVYPAMSSWSQIHDIVDVALGSAMNGEGTAEELLKSAQDDIEKLLEKTD